MVYSPLGVDGRQDSAFLGAPGLRKAIERLGDRKITIVPIPEDLELYVDHQARSGDQLESLELAGRHARIGCYFPPSRPADAYAIAIADFDAGADEADGAD